MRDVSRETFENHYYVFSLFWTQISIPSPPPLQVRGALSGGWGDASVSENWKLPLIQTSPNPLLIALRNWSRRLAWFESSGYSQSASLLAHNRMLLRSLSGVACTTPDTSKSQPTAYCFEQLKQATCLIQLKCIFMHEHNQTGMSNWFVAIAYSGKSHLTWLLSRNICCVFCISVLILSIHLLFSIFIPISL